MSEGASSSAAPKPTPAKTKSESKAKAESKSKPKPKAKAESEIKSESEARSESEAKPEAKKTSSKVATDKKKPVKKSAKKGEKKEEKDEKSEFDYIQHAINANKDGSKGFIDPAKEELEDFPWFARFLEKHERSIYIGALVAGVLLPLVPSIALLVFVSRNRTFGGTFVWLVEDYRPSVQVIISMIVSVLTYLNVLTISNLLRQVGVKLADNFVLQWLLSNSNMKDDAKDDDNKSKDSEHGWTDKDTDNLTKATTKTYKKFRENWKKVTWHQTWVGLICCALLAAPHVIWTGTLTPNNVLEVAVDPSPANLASGYSQSTSANWADNMKLGSQCSSGFPESESWFTGCAGLEAMSSAISSIEVAYNLSAADNSFNHSTPSNVSYMYVGRSYGVAAGAGILYPDIDPSEGVPVGRFYYEMGYLSNISCSRNSTSAVTISKSNSSSSSLVIYNVSGRLPNSNNQTSYPVVGSTDSPDAVAWSAQSSSNQEHMLALAAIGQTYSALDKIQCTIALTSHNFSVYVNDNTSEIYVQPDAAAPGFDPTGQLANTAIAQLGYISQFQASPYSSPLGRAIVDNMASRAFDLDPDSASPTLTDQQQLDAVADSVSVALDDVLVYIGASQLALQAGADTSQVQYHALVKRAQIGTLAYAAVAMLMTGVLFIMASARLAVLLHRRRNGLDGTGAAGEVKHGTPQLVDAHEARQESHEG